MTRTHLLGAASAAALACLSTVSHAQVPPITGGGSTLAQFDYTAEFSVFNAAKKPIATFSTYWEAGSGTGQQAFIYDDLTCDINKVQNGGACSGPAGGAGNTVDYGASDSTLSSAQISTWATSSFGQSAAGNLIQLPSMGVGISIPVNNPAITANGQLEVSDNDLCGIFSGLLTDFSQITDSKTTPTPGPFNVVYRTDGSGTSFLLTSHLSAVCNANNTNPAVTFSATTTFATLFPNNGAGVINSSAFPNAIGEAKSSGVANELAGCNGALPDAFGYLSPDFTTVDPQSGATLGCQVNGSNKSPLVVAGVFNGKKSYTPTIANIKLGLLHPQAGTGQNLTPPSNATEGANPALWVPLEPLVTAGYPIVGYTTFDFAQCYASTSVATAVGTFLADHYKVGKFTIYQKDNGFVTLSQSHASKFLTTIEANILANKNGWNTDIEDATACSGLAGR